jgi:hypothetical protein
METSADFSHSAEAMLAVILACIGFDDMRGVE